MEALAVATAASAVVVGLAVRRWLVFTLTVDSDSMTPALRPGQRLLVLRRWAVRGHVRRGDIVVVPLPELRRAVVKRVLGLPGECVVVSRDGTVRVDGSPVPEPYVLPGSSCRGGSFLVPPGHVLLLGDSRARSWDSRQWLFPYAPLTAVRGRVIPTRGTKRRGRRTPAASTDNQPRALRVGDQRRTD